STTVTGVPVGSSVTLRWTISNGSCSTSDVLVLTNSAQPTIAVAGAGQELCSTGTFVMAANAPVVGSGEWSIVGSANGAIIDDLTSPTTIVDGLSLGSSVTLRWTITNGACSSIDEVVLINSDVPTVAVAGPDQFQCNNGTFAMAANTPGVGTGLWSFVGASNGAAITNVNSPTTTVTGLAAGATTTLRWTISNGSCISFEEVTLS